MIHKAILFVAMTLPAALGYVYFVLLAPGSDGGFPLIRVAYPAAKLVQLALPLIAIRWFVKVADGGLRRPTGLVLGISFGIATGLAIVGLAEAWRDTLLADAPRQVANKVEEFGLRSPGRFIAFAVFLCIVHAFFEELYWRRFVHNGLRNFLPFWPAALLSGLAFSAHHIFVLQEYLPGRFWSVAVPLNLGIAAGGVVWAWLYERTGSILSPWISHGIVDAAIMWVGYRMIFG